MRTKHSLFFTIVFSLIILLSAHAQEQNPSLIYNLMKTDYKTKNYDAALKHLDWLLDNSPSLSKNIYLYGGNILKGKFKKSAHEGSPELIALGNKLFQKRFEVFPDLHPAKGHSDYADFLVKTGGAKDEIYKNYEEAYKVDPTKLGVKSIATYFGLVVERNKDNNAQYVFDTYDHTIEAINKKLEGYLENIQKLNHKKEQGETLISAEEKKLRAYTVNSKALGMVESILEKKVEEISTCEYLVPLYKEQYEANKDNAQWLSRSINRMFKKECTETELYVKLVGKYQEISPSPQASVLYAGILMDRGETNKAIQYFEKAISQETDPSKKAKNLMTVANIFRKKGQHVKVVKYAKKAIKQKPNLGRAYTLIATSYAKAANKCGKGEFEKRMVYAAAEKYAKLASYKDPSIASYAGKLAKSYGANKPSKKLVFNNDLGLKSGDSYTINCWIGETVRVP